MSNAKLRKSATKDMKQQQSAPTASPENKDLERYTQLLLALSEKAPEKVKPYMQKASPVVAMIFLYIKIATPYIVQAACFVSDVINKLPDRVFYALLGFTICFCGGVFPTTIAAVEAWKLCGGNEAMRSGKELLAEWTKVLEANKKDNEEDKDDNGIADVDEISPQELLLRKSKLAMKSVDPNKINKELALIYTGWIGVIAVLKIQFAKTVTLGNMIGDKLYGAVAFYAEKQVLAVTPEENKKWVPIVLQWMCKAVAISLAWWIQRVISAFHSAIRGGQIFGRELVNFLHEKGFVNWKDEDTYMDEAVGWAVAALGLLFQWTFRFSMPFPLNILLFPVTMLETFIIWSVSN